MKILYDTSLIQYITLFESLTGAKIKDCLFYNGQLTFIVQEGNLGRAIGKNASNIKRVEQVLKKKIRVFEFSPKIETFTLNIIYPTKPDKIEFNDNTLFIHIRGSEQKGLLRGREGKNLTSLKNILSRYFKISSIKMI